MDWARLPYFLAVAQTGSLRAAAEHIGATHATVDRNLRALEDDYGVRLFNRSKAGLQLTAAGEVLLPLAQEADNAVTNARRRVQGLDDEPRGSVRLSMPAGFVPSRFARILADFERKYPEIELRIAVTNRFENINRSETDVSIRVAHQIDDDVVGRKVLQYAGGIFASQDYLDRHWEDAGPGGEGLQWIGWGEPDPAPAWVKASPFPKAKLRYRVQSPTMIGQLVAAGVGMSYLPYSSRDWIPGLVPMPGTKPYLDRSIWLLLHSDLRRTTRVRVLVDHLADEIKALRDVFLGPLA
ncbi:MAG: LysR family transcriptional regulator [Pelagimonas sp.]|uniref:LysR family transcriptional regulator n=1 Tax=Pelagimonas sp. TaxID=2073170 RepID=UPI003D6AE459